VRSIKAERTFAMDMIHPSFHPSILPSFLPVNPGHILIGSTEAAYIYLHIENAKGYVLIAVYLFIYLFVCVFLA